MCGAEGVYQNSSRPRCQRYKHYLASGYPTTFQPASAQEKYTVRAEIIAGTNLHISTKLLLPVQGKKVETGFRMFLLLTYSNQNKQIQIEIFLFNELYELTMATGTNRR